MSAGSVAIAGKALDELVLALQVHLIGLDRRGDTEPADLADARALLSEIRAAGGAVFLVGERSPGVHPPRDTGWTPPEAVADEDDLLTHREAAAVIGVSTKTIQRARRCGDLAVVTTPNGPRIARAELTRYATWRRQHGR